MQTAPFYNIKWYAFANRLNYRNHRKIIVIDGKVGFVGGINISDRYRNDLNKENHLYWRDTHLMIKGQATAIYNIYLWVIGIFVVLHLLPILNLILLTKQNKSILQIVSSP